ncbi:hypothetical protein [Nocardia sp. NBC_01327]|uniref:hypothetical protein n=1 Tax=Nocardia sp. NBC_01327 TaxID=2903593 RepID=UPI002E1640EA|nr:hypothetical protein OG326_21075 [Nocardia sp. NBC_01327]
MSTTGQSAGALRLLAEITARYSSLDAFCVQLRRELEDPTVVLPRVVEPAEASLLAYSADSTILSALSGSGGRHVLVGG